MWGRWQIEANTWCSKMFDNFPLLATSWFVFSESLQVVRYNVWMCKIGLLFTKFHRRTDHLGGMLLLTINLELMYELMYVRWVAGSKTCPTTTTGISGYHLMPINDGMLVALVLHHIAGRLSGCLAWHAKNLVLNRSVAIIWEHFIIHLHFEYITSHKLW